MPPTRKRLFMGAVDVGKQLTAAQRRRTVAMTKLGHLALPDGSKRYPETYVTALLQNIRGVINADSVRRFHNTTAAKESLRLADVDLHGRLDEWLAETTLPGYLTANALTWVFGIDHSRPARWHRDGLVASQQVNKQTLIQVADPLAKCQWVLPKK